MKKLIQNILQLRSINVYRKVLKCKKVPEPDQSVRIIVEEIVANTEDKHINNGKIVLQCLKCLKMRYYHYPLQYALKMWYFRNLKIKIQPPLLIPRFETEHFTSLMIDKIREKWAKGSNLTLVDFCCGTGVIGLSILKQLGQEYNIKCIFVDISSKAVQYTRFNAQINGIPERSVEAVEGDMNAYLHLIKSCDVLLSNPPYLSDRQYRRLQHQVKLFQDKRALLSGQQGIDLVTPLLQAIVEQKKLREDSFVAGIQYGGQSVQYLNLQSKVVLDQYGKRRYLIF